MLKYLKIIKLSLIDRLTYKQELFTSLLVGVLIFCGQYFFWSAVFSEREVVGGFTFEQIIFYYLFVRIVSEIVDSRLAFRVNDMILDGTVSNLLLKPVKVKLFIFFQDLGSIIMDIFTKVFFYVLLFFIIFNSINIELVNVPIFFITLVFSITIGFNLALLMGMLAFKIDNASALIYAFRRLILFMAGGIVPLSVFPSLFYKIISFLPFRYMVDLPVSTILGTVSNKELGRGLIIQIIWAVGLWIFSSFLLKTAIKHNESVGI